MLQKFCYKTSFDRSSIEALERFQNKPGGFDLIITDFTMPDMTGLELAEQIRKLNNVIPIILVTGYNETVPLKSNSHNPIGALLKKPINYSTLAANVRKVLD